MFNWQTSFSSSSCLNSLNAHLWQIKLPFLVCCGCFTANILWSSHVPSMSCVSPRKSCAGLWHFLWVMLNLSQSASNLQQELVYCTCQDRLGLWHSSQQCDLQQQGPTRPGMDWWSSGHRLKGNRGFSSPPSFQNLWDQVWCGQSGVRED